MALILHTRISIAQPLHFGTSMSESLLVTALGVGAVFSILVAVLSFMAFYHRRTKSYLLIVVAFSTFLGKTSAGVAYLTGWMDAGMHHSFEHLLDVIMMTLVY
ncbi:DUF7471 family protein [Haloarcula marismortui]|uniref:Uncharacterized protein n=2 Tax=Haloarcula marismortui ATCC 33800 TaxID=662476 RepID=A0A8T8KK83_9EURY|nr:hypothetical protein [Haloarcula sinaiiensis]QUJ74267.1 hypothetical protein KDQ40_17615 [Haloarcula sinaiiensis ATCC 33800]